MKKLLLIIFIACFSLSVFAQSNMKSKISQVMSSDASKTPVLANNNIAPNPIFVPYFPIPAGAIPYLTSFSDYVTNGNTLNQIYVNGDTVVIAQTYLDTANVRAPNGSPFIRINYNYSFNGGSTWLASGQLNYTDVKSRYPDIALVGSGSSRTIEASGRYWFTGGTLRAAGICRDAALGAGSGTTVFVPGTGQAGNTDLFSTIMSNGNIGCIFQSGAANDTIFFLT